MLYDVHKVQEPTQSLLAVTSGYEGASQPGFRMVLRKNREYGLIKFPTTDTVKLTEDGWKAAGEIVNPPTCDREVHDFIKADISPAYGKVFDVSGVGR